MQAVATQPIIRQRDEKNERFGNEASLASVEALLHNLAIKCFKRVQAMGLGMEFEDVLQEMMLSYVKASQKWNPNGGSRFATYCQTTCLNNFNHAVEKMARERAHLGLVPLGDMVKNEDGGEVDPMEVLGAAAASPFDAPDARLNAAANMMESLSGLSLGARRLLAHLLESERRHAEGDPNYFAEPIKLREAARLANLDDKELRRVKLEILNTFGVRFQ